MSGPHSSQSSDHYIDISDSQAIVIQNIISISNTLIRAKYTHSTQ